MDAAGIDIFMWVMSFFCLLGFIIASVNLLDSEDVMFALLFIILFGGSGAALSLGALKDAEMRAQDKIARQDLATAGYDFTYASHRHIKLLVGGCVWKFEVRKIGDVYRPVIPAAKDLGKHQVLVLTPKFQKTTCPA